MHADEICVFICIECDASTTLAHCISVTGIFLCILNALNRTNPMLLRLQRFIQLLHLSVSLFLSHALSLMLSMLFLHFSGSLVLSKYIVDVWDHIGISVCIRFQTNKQTNGLTTTITNTQVENKVMNISPHIHSIHLYRFCVCVLFLCEAYFDVVLFV